MTSAPIVIVGGGLAGCLAAIALVERRPDLPLLLVESDSRFGGNHIWSFFDSDIRDDQRWLVTLLRPHRWETHDIRFPKRRRSIDLAYNSARSERLDEVVRERLRPDQYRLNTEVVNVGPDAIHLAGGEVIRASAVIDARGPIPVDGVTLAWQKFVGVSYQVDQGHGIVRPVVMDAMVDQSDGYRFVYLLPFSATELLIEDTYYSSDPGLDAPKLRQLIEDYAHDKGWQTGSVIAEESGILPVVLSGSWAAFWPAEEAGVTRLGLRGGFFHPTTGYSLPDAVANAMLLAGQADLSGAALYRLFRSQAESLWGKRSFYRMLNRMLFGAAGPDQRYKMLEHFYRLPGPVIARFYAGASTTLDKLRILSGRPPVPVLRALSTIKVQP